MSLLKGESPQIQPRVSIIIPAYNEGAAILSGALDGIVEWASARPYCVEVILVDDGSTDNTGILAARQVRVVRAEHGGKGVALMTGFEEARGAIVAMTDLDFSAPPRELCRLIEAIEAGADFAIGSRGAMRKGMSRYRRIISRVHGWVRDMVLGLPFHDTQCGLKAFRREALAKVTPRMKRFHRGGGRRARGADVQSGFDQELLVHALHEGLLVREIPVEWRHDPAKESRVKTMDAVKGLGEVIRLRMEYGRVSAKKFHR